MSNTLTQNQINGSKGGKKVLRKYGKAWLREIASYGGQAVVEKYGDYGYMSVLGKLGANAVNGNLSPTALIKTQRLARKIVRENQ